VKATTIYEGQREAVVQVSHAKGSSVGLVADASIYRYQLQVLAKAETERFKIQLEAYEKAPDVYRFRRYFDALEELLDGHRLYIVPRSENEVLQIDMEQKSRADMLNVNLEEGIK